MVRLQSILNEEKINLLEIAEYTKMERDTLRTQLSTVRTQPSGCYCECTCCEKIDVTVSEPAMKTMKTC